ncbi:hypothetical protein PPROV_000678400 [Pycnococcus provasolii]|uniref:Uncharacterized protein n=1 Tax=Pycnococcus provasolii TaxID=41880 RepID=A0A830HME0_9CHLO|nr:hypothetical protein PPROV_000678400 [Pycnococcus provasolii]
MALAKVLHEANLPGYQRLYVEALKHPEIFQRQTHHENFKEFCQAKGECVPHHTTQHPDVCRGLSVGYIKNLAQKHRLGEYKTKHVVRDFVKPKTKDEQSRFIDLSSERENATNVAEVFISHCWEGDFQDVLDGIQELGDDRIVWLDVFCVNQHGDGPPPPCWRRCASDDAGDHASDDARKQNKEDVANFKAVLKACSSLLLVISKIDQVYLVQNRCSVGNCFGMSICRMKAKEIRGKIPFFRIWCLNELFNAHMFYKDKIFMLPGRNPPSIFKELSELVDVERAEATKQSDIQLVQGWIKDACGFEELNRTIKRVVANVEWNSGSVV